MISTQDKQKILNGAFGLSRNGYKCRYIGKRRDSNFPYEFVYYEEDEVIIDVAHLSEEFTYLKDFKNDLDVVGLWETKVEPFDLEKALQGSPVLLRNGNKAYVKFLMPKEYKGLYPIRGYVLDDINPSEVYALNWSLEGKISREEGEYPFDIIGMYKESEPEPNTVTLTLPCPLREPRDEMWFIDLNQVARSNFNKSPSLDAFQIIPYFGSKEDAQAWLDAMKGSKKS